MADDAKTTAKAAGNTAVPDPAHGDHDRVAMLSLKADGTPDQNAPEIIGDKEFAQAATREQFKQQAVSATDSAKAQAAEPAEETPQDPTIAEAQAEHEKVAKAAEKAADATVDALFTDDGKSKS